jgi:hypothetical protein
MSKENNTPQTPGLNPPRSKCPVRGGVFTSRFSYPGGQALGIDNYRLPLRPSSKSKNAVQAAREAVAYFAYLTDTLEQPFHKVRDELVRRANRLKVN